MLKVRYPKHMIDKAKAIVAETATIQGDDAKSIHCNDRCGLSIQYLKGIGIKYHHPSNRTMMNLGYEVYAKDLATGEFILLEMEIKCDWNTRNPRMNPVSMPVYVTVPDSTSTTSE